MYPLQLLHVQCVIGGNRVHEQCNEIIRYYRYYRYYSHVHVHPYSVHVHVHPYKVHVHVHPYSVHVHVPCSLKCQLKL